MAGDITRSSFNPLKHFTSVRMQQGRVSLDADWNEQADITSRYARVTSTDVIGGCGVPKEGGGFQIRPTPDNSDLLISPGRIYVDGLLCELEATPIPISAVNGTAVTLPFLTLDGKAFAAGQWVELLSDANLAFSELHKIAANGIDANARTLTLGAAVPAAATHLRRATTYLTQPDFPGVAPALPPADGDYYLYIDVWERDITVLEDASIGEVALGGADTATRTRLVWQLKLLPVTAPAACDTDDAAWAAIIGRQAGRLRARTKPPVGGTNPCSDIPGSGYQRLENQVYRVEIHDIRADGTVTFKWSRDNAAVVTAWTNQNGNDLVVESLGRDEVLGFTGNQWIELTDDARELRGEAGTLVFSPTTRPEDRVIVINPATAQPAGGATALNQFTLNPRLRRWDSSGEQVVTFPAATGGWLDLEGGIQVRFEENAAYRVGDYWLIPARTAFAGVAGDIEWARDLSGEALPLPPHGVVHHYCRLATAQFAGAAAPVLTDCRPRFPSLTTICAEDVCFDNANCQLPGASTVQEAIDELCQRTDLRFHNKHLHGWGIVCGLQVVCGDDAERGTILIRPGYALDCEGTDLIVSRDMEVNLLSAIAKIQREHPETPLLDDAGNGEVCLSIYADARERVRLEIEKLTPPPSVWDRILPGTLLYDVIQDCLLPLYQFVQEIVRVPAGEANAKLVGPGRERLITLLNLFVQFFSPENGYYVFLSAKEDQILREIYEKLIQLLQSETFCAMFENARPFPDYPFPKERVSTIFSKGTHRRVRVNERAGLVYTTGGDSTIYVFNADRGELVEELDFPAGGAVVQDVAFSDDGSEVYAVATINQIDSIFAIARIQNGQHVWQQPVSIICDVKLVTLGTAADHPNVIAIGKGIGLYQIDPSNIPANLEPQYGFNAVGHLQVCRYRGSVIAIASENNGGGETDTYDSLRQMDISSPQQLQEVALPVGPGDDDICALTNEDNEYQGITFVVLERMVAAGEKMLARVSIEDGQMDVYRTPLEHTTILMAYNRVTGYLMLTYEDSYRVGLVDIDKDVVSIDEYRQPVQIAPVALATARNGEIVYVLNAVSTTLTVAAADYFTPGTALPLQPLVDYRNEIFNAFTDLLAGLVQYLKDCFCDHLLVNCPECDGSDKVYLACVNIRGNRVYKVCNFERRKYVKSFPTMSYWLSLIPVGPVVSLLVEEFCCLVVPDLFGRYDARRDVAAKSGYSGNQMRSAFYALSRFTNIDLRNLGGDFQRLFNPLKLFAGDWFNFRGSLSDPRPQETINNRQILTRDTLTATKSIENIGAEVVVSDYQPVANIGSVMTYSAAALSTIRPEDRVILFQQDGVVKSFRVERGSAALTARRAAKPAASQVAAAPVEDAPEAERLRAEVAALRADLESLQNNYQTALEALNSRANEIKSLGEGIESLRAEFSQLKPAPKPSTRSRKTGDT